MYTQVLQMDRGGTVDPIMGFVALTNLGICYHKLKQPTQALQHFTTARDFAVECQLPLREQVR